MLEIKLLLEHLPKKSETCNYQIKPDQPVILLTVEIFHTLGNISHTRVTLIRESHMCIILGHVTIF